MGVTYTYQFDMLVSAIKTIELKKRFRKETDQMPLYMDVHYKVEGATEETVADVHSIDLGIQTKYGARYNEKWVDKSIGTIFCLVEAPDKEAAERGPP